MNPADLEDLVAEYIERCESGEILEPDSFAREHPEAGPALLEALGRLQGTESMFPTILSDLPERIGPYRTLGEIGRGGMGRVLRVERTDRPDKPLALKLLTLASKFNPRSMERLSREGKILQRLRHPGIVKVVEVGTAGGSPYIVMDLLRGPILAKIIRNARSAGATAGSGCLSDRLDLPEPGSGPVRAARVAASLARAVEAAHTEGLIHRDLKPGNVVLTRDGQPVLIDFGLAGGEAGPTLTLSGDVLGTPHYMAPEQARGERAEEQSDIYGLGAVLYEMLTLQPPHPGEDPLQVVEAVKGRPIRSVRSIDARVPRDLDTIVRRCLAYRAGRRYPDACSLAEDLEAFVEGKPIRAKRPGPVERASDWVRFHRPAVVSAGALLLIGILVGLLVMKGSGEKSARLRHAHERAAMAWAAGDRKGLESAAREMLDLDPGESLGTFLLARAEGRNAEAPGDGVVETIAEGIRLLDEGKTREAVKALKRAVTLAPGIPLPVVMLGVSARKAGVLDVAEEELTAAVRILPESAVLHRELALVYRANHRLDDAEETMLKAVDLGPEDASSWHELARVRLDQQMKLDEADRQFEKSHEAAARAVALAGKEVTRRQLRTLGNILDRLKRFKEAQRIYRDLLKKDPRSFVDRWYLAYSLDSEHRAVEARDEYEKLLKIRPGEPNTAMILGFFYAGARRGECVKCDALYEKHPEFDDPDKAEHYGLMALRSGKGRNEGRIDTLVRIARQIGRTKAFMDLIGKLKEQAYRRKKYDRAARLDKVMWRLERVRKK